MIKGLLTGGGIIAAVIAGSAFAQTYPIKPVTLVVGYPAGGPVDAFARALGQRLTEELKQSFIIDNKPGANEIIASQHVARAQPDGYTIFVSTEAPLTQNQFLYKKLGYNPVIDLMPVSQLVSVPMTLAVSPGFPANTLKEFLEVARKRQENPIAYASGGVGGVTHLPMAMLAKNEDFKWSHVPYKGAAPILPDLMVGHVDATILAVSFLQQHINEKKLKALAVYADKRAASLPNVPTFKELGIRDIRANFIIGMVAPKGTPQPIAEKLASVSKRVMQDKSFRERFMDPFAFTEVGSSPTEFSAYLVADRVVQEERVKVSGATLD
ncbi:tripartite tricarboxylate transporter substrate binding protein [Acidovorax sp. D2M1]|uniref:Tripartite tricarboxylate transporter substrate binding protein n=1 Tax=Acidovorax benzenivorans TaxID=2987520 RepID=A0ABT5RZZ5_9BURK|nr:tripartite tricarboxylate transporter substrate binding protein [Acidovorax benzenivorans]MDD2179282.1 tripartite tricarboxylate transporter substrate binding protein [Acidovorax benzenivorans]